VKLCRSHLFLFFCGSFRHLSFLVAATAIKARNVMASSHPQYGDNQNIGLGSSKRNLSQARHTPCFADPKQICSFSDTSFHRAFTFMHRENARTSFALRFLLAPRFTSPRASFYFLQSRCAASPATSRTARMTSTKPASTFRVAFTPSALPKHRQARFVAAFTLRNLLRSAPLSSHSRVAVVHFVHDM